MKTCLSPDFRQKQVKQRDLLWSLMGDLPPRYSPLPATCYKVEKIKGGTLETLLFHPEEDEDFEAYFALPDPSGRKSGKIPVILYNHSHGSMYDLGKKELCLGAPYQNGPYLNDLLQEGWAVLCMDHRAFGSRSGEKESVIFKKMLWQGKVMWGMMVYDSVRMLDYLVHKRPEIDPERIATLGMSMGSTMAWFTAALDERIRVCADICCMTDYESLMESGNLDGHGLYYYVPSLLKYFDTAAINALIAPRAHISLNGKYDGLTPEAGLDKIDRTLKKIYKDLGSPEHWLLKKYPVQHCETAEMRQEILAFLRKHL